MRPVTYSRADSIDDAILQIRSAPQGAFLAGGTTEIDLIRAGVSPTEHLIDINSLELAAVRDLPDGGLRIGALARMADVATMPTICERFPAVAESLLLAASPQLRNMASIGGNLRQRTRCSYLRDGVSPCNKREPGSGCAALAGLNRGHAILGTSDQCIATHPSDLAVALTAFDAVIQLVGSAGPRAVPIDEFFLLPGHTPQNEHAMFHDELIVGIDLPEAPIAARSVYLKIRDRQSYEFALVSVAAALEVRDGVVAGVRLALGGLGTKPWRARRAEEELLGARAEVSAFRRAAEAELVTADLRQHNAFKLPLAQRAIVRALVHRRLGAGL